VCLLVAKDSGASAIANAALSNYTDFANLLHVGHLPPWYYAAYTSVRLMALNKIDPRDLLPGQQMDGRPVGIGLCRRRINTRALLKLVKEPTINECGPTQYGCGRSGVASGLIFAVQAHLAAHPDHVLFSADVFNCYNESKRQAMLVRLRASTDPAMSSLAAPFFLLLGPLSYIGLGRYGNIRDVDFSSDEGFQQGSAEGSVGCC
jgi:hypothetical protein